MVPTERIANRAREAATGPPLRASTSSKPIACSGLMYAGVPMAKPVPVNRSPPAAVTARAIPKSATTARPPVSNTFSGLISRCTTPRSCA